jgi:hypothetical protein
MELRARRLIDECEPMGFPEAAPPTAAIPRARPRSDAGYQLALELTAPRPAIPELADGGPAGFNCPPPSKPQAANATGTAAVIMELRELPGRQRLLDPAWASIKGLRGRSSMLSEMIEIIGEEAALQLIRAFGGTRLYVPHSPEPNDMLASAIGLAAAIKLARVYGGDRLDVPNPPPRRLRIVQLREAGMSVDAIAREVRCTRRRVFQVLAEVRPPSRSA